MNEAFSVGRPALARMLDVDPETVNVNGGAMALGHPIGASGPHRRDPDPRPAPLGGGLGLAAICSGGGQGDALLIEV